MKPAPYKPVRYASTHLKQLVWRLKDVEELPTGFDRNLAVNSPEDLKRYDFLFRDFPGERFVVFILSSKNTIQAVDVVSEGTFNASLVHPREVFRSAILGLGAAIIVAHNHPSGTAEPSREDLEVTRQLAEAGKILGIRLLDHVIFAGDQIVSLAGRGVL